jgi:SAM-dependent methyltransferase
MVAITGDNRRVSDALEYDPGLYRGTAGDYDRFRVGYPQVMLGELLGFVQPSGRGRLLDLACGTGQVTFAIARAFAEVWAVDQEPDMIRVVSDKASASGASQLRATVSPAEELDAPTGMFELVANRLRLRARPATWIGRATYAEARTTHAVAGAKRPEEDPADQAPSIGCAREDC